MHSVIVLGLFVATATAASLGYEYGVGVSETNISPTRSPLILTNGGLSSVSSTPVTIIERSNDLSGINLVTNKLVGSNEIVGVNNLLATNRRIPFIETNNIVNAVGIGSGTRLLNRLGTSSRGSNTIVLDSSVLDSIPPTVEYSKQFFHFSAPQEEQQQSTIQRQLSNVLKKNLQVVFINAPENNAATNAALQLAKQAIEQKTAIYVLTKENDAAQVIAKFQQIQENIPTTPEVRFIKYRTPEDAAIAKAEIQAQYDKFGGLSENFNGGVAPVLNYASSGPISGSTTLLSGDTTLLSGGTTLLSGSPSIIKTTGVPIDTQSVVLSNAKSEAYLPPPL